MAHPGQPAVNSFTQVASNLAALSIQVITAHSPARPPPLMSGLVGVVVAHGTQ